MKAKIVKVNEDGTLDVVMPDGTERKGVKPPGAKKSSEPSSKPEGAGEPQKFFQYELELGGVTINEWRASKGLPRAERFGDLTFPEYVLAHPEAFAMLAAAKTGDLAPDPGGETEAGDGTEAP